MQTIAIVGLGLIGGSLGLDFVERGYRVMGVARRQETCQQALTRGVVHQAETHLNLVKTANVVFICTPIATVLDTLASLLPHLNATAVVTDVGSVKAALVDAATDLWPNFVGGHPMAGKAEAGLAVAEAGLFAGRPYVLTPTGKTNPEAVAVVKGLVGQLHCQLYECQPAEHDRAVAWISHLPVMVSSCLIQACQGEADPAILALARSLASSGFRDTSRVGGGDPQLGLMMARYNRQALLHSLESYQAQLADLVEMVCREDWDHLLEHLTHTQLSRQEFMGEP